MDKDGRRHVGLYLDGKNYDSWKFWIKLALQSDELWGVMNGTERKPELVRTNTLYICMLTCWVLVSQRAHMWSVCASYQRGSLVVICMEAIYASIAFPHWENVRCVATCGSCENWQPALRKCEVGFSTWGACERDSTLRECETSVRYLTTISFGLHLSETKWNPGSLECSWC